MNICMLVFVFLHLVRLNAQLKSSILTSKDSFVFSFQQLVPDLLKNADNCAAFIYDNVYSDLFSSINWENDKLISIFSLKIEENENLANPNKKIVKILSTMTNEACFFYMIFLSNGFQASRFFYFIDKYELSTVPFPAPIKQALITKRIDLWTGGKFRFNNDLFYDKTISLNNQILNVFVIEHEPAIVISRSDTELVFSGVEMNILNTLASRLDFQLNITAVNSYSELENKRNFANVILANLFYNAHNLETFDLSVPYQTECLTFLTPESLRDFSHQTLVWPFKLDLWLVLLITVFLISILLNQINRNSSDLFQNVNSFFYTFGVLMMVSLPRLPNNNWPLRILIGSFWFFSILMGVIYRASITAILADPVIRTTIDSANELVESGIHYGGQSKIFKDFFEMQNDSLYSKIGTQFEVLNISAKEGVQKVLKGEFGLFDNINFLNKLMNEFNEAERKKRLSSSNSKLHVMKSCIVNVPVSIGFERNFPLKQKFDHHLQKMVEGGLIKKWIRDLNEFRIEKQSSDSEAQALMTFKKFFMALVWIVSGLLLSALVLALEYFYWTHHVQRRPNFDPYLLDNYFASKDHKTFFDRFL